MWSAPPRGWSIGWGWFCVWAAVGAAAALSVVSLGPIFFVAVIGLAMIIGLRRPASWRSASGFLTGAGALLLYVAWVQRTGPGTTWSATATTSRCDEHLNPLPWLAVGVVLFAAGIALQLRRR
jgi:hypothetical protein